MSEPASPTAIELRDGIASGAVRAPELADVLIGHIEKHEPEIHAWAWFDADFVRQQAKALHDHRAAGRPLGRLHGVPVGIKDIIDTAKIPTENGASLDAGRVPHNDAFIVARLKQEGAIIMGKTVTTELAFMDPSPTRNPANTEYTPGGSSSGSAAAVAAGMVPFAVGSQTGGSIIRPASFCGVVGYKPSFGLIPRTGVLPQSPSLDTIGVLARTVGDAALLAEVLCGYDPADPATSPAPIPHLLDTCLSSPAVKPELAFVRQPAWDQAEEDMKDAFDELVEVLGEQCVEVDLPNAFAEAALAQGTIQSAELAKNFFAYTRRGLDKLGPNLQAGIAAGEKVLARDYLAAKDWPRLLTPMLGEVFDRFDAIITPAALGPAPKGFSSTGNPAFNGIWTLCGTPAVTIPVLTASNGMPMGVQLVGRRGDDGRLLRTARWLHEHLTELSRAA